MQEISAAIGLQQIKILDELNRKRGENARFLTDELSHLNPLSFQNVEGPRSHSWYMFAMRLDEESAGISRDNFVMKLRQMGVEADVAWPRPIHLQPFYMEHFGFRAGDFPKAEAICSSVSQLPVHPFLIEGELSTIVSTVKGILRDQ